MGWKPSKETQELVSNPETARAVADAITAANGKTPIRVPLPDGRVIELDLVVPVTK